MPIIRKISWVSMHPKEWVWCFFFYSLINTACLLVSLLHLILYFKNSSMLTYIENSPFEPVKLSATNDCQRLSWLKIEQSVHYQQMTRTYCRKRLPFWDHSLKGYCYDSLNYTTSFRILQNKFPIFVSNTFCSSSFLYCLVLADKLAHTNPTYMK